MYSNVVTAIDKILRSYYISTTDTCDKYLSLFPIIAVPSANDQLLMVYHSLAGEVFPDVPKSQYIDPGAVVVGDPAGKTIMYDLVCRFARCL